MLIGKTNRGTTEIFIIQENNRKSMFQLAFQIQLFPDRANWVDLDEELAVLQKNLNFIPINKKIYRNDSEDILYELYDLTQGQEYSEYVIYYKTIEGIEYKLFWVSDGEMVKIVGGKLYPLKSQACKPLLIVDAYQGFDVRDIILENIEKLKLQIK